MRRHLPQIALILIVSVAIYVLPGAAQKEVLTLPGARPSIDAAQYRSLQAAVDALPEGGGLVRLPAGTLEISQPLVIHQSDVDAVVIALPVPLHYPATLEALRAGKHVLCEKPPAVTARLAVEAGVSMGWGRYVGLAGDVIGIDRFGASAPYKVLVEKFGFTGDAVAARAQELLKS